MFLLFWFLRGSLWPHFKKQSNRLIVKEWLQESKVAKSRCLEGRQARRSVLPSVRSLCIRATRRWATIVGMTHQMLTVKWRNHQKQSKTSKQNTHTHTHTHTHDTEQWLLFWIPCPFYGIPPWGFLVSLIAPPSYKFNFKANRLPWKGIELNTLYLLQEHHH